MPDPGPVLCREAQMRGEFGEVVEHAGDRPRVAVGSRGREGVGAAAGLGGGDRARLRRQVSTIAQ
jgi:hypothetical protein